MDSCTESNKVQDLGKMICSALLFELSHSPFATDSLLGTPACLKPY